VNHENRPSRRRVEKKDHFNNPIANPAALDSIFSVAFRPGPAVPGSQYDGFYFGNRATVHGRVFQVPLDPAKFSVHE